MTGAGGEDTDDEEDAEEEDDEVNDAELSCFISFTGLPAKVLESDEPAEFPPCSAVMPGAFSAESMEAAWPWTVVGFRDKSFFLEAGACLAATSLSESESEEDSEDSELEVSVDTGAFFALLFAFGFTLSGRETFLDEFLVDLLLAFLVGGSPSEEVSEDESEGN